MHSFYFIQTHGTEEGAKLRSLTKLAKLPTARLASTGDAGRGEVPSGMAGKSHAQILDEERRDAKSESIGVGGVLDGWDVCDGNVGG